MCMGSIPEFGWWGVPNGRYDFDFFAITLQILSVLKIITGFKYIAYDVIAFGGIWSCILHLHGFQIHSYLKQ